MAKGKSNNMDSLFGGFTAPNLNLSTENKVEDKKPTEIIKEQKKDEVIEEPVEKVQSEGKTAAKEKESFKKLSTYSKKEKTETIQEERGVSLRLAEEIDETYLDVVSIQNDMSKKQFLANIMADAVQEARSIKPKDIDYSEPFRKDVKLKCKQVTILLPSDLYDEINVMAKKYGMATARYIAWSVHKARMKDPEWGD